MEETEYLLIADFLKEHYEKWAGFLAARGVSEDVADQMIDELENLAGL
ncbi:hypothetical protein SAMN02949497_1642 [Methylomagnum ishizawai]|uniref:Uncharacterized protein n=1 Tax=Methylomagnum ishizawai TaxID=1760988 RepID=A0A1Y6D188_9GAMM|nr:hypothetical protein [Methylomagnum ishizawai]SMF94332.1 hypothetical protein SAMN02949497_1642 [Methylomagnum ishizawai]